MSAYGSTVSGHSAGHAKHRGGPISIPWVLLASLLIGIGLFVVAYWLYSFNLWFTWGIALVVAGALMLFIPRVGADHA